VVRFIIAAAVVAIVADSETSGQQPAPSQPTFRTGTSLVTVDTVVVDGDGRHHTSLTAADFEIVLDGKPLPVRQAVYVPLGPDAPAQPGAATPAVPAPGRLGPDPAFASLRASSRAIAIVVDDLGLSFEGTAYTRQMLQRFIDTQVAPGDLVAILRTSAGVGALQQFTTDKRLLYAALDRVRWSVMSRSGVSAFPALGSRDLLGDRQGGNGTADANDEDSVQGLRTSMLVAGSLGALEYVIRGAERLPGRKAVIFVSEGMRLFPRAQGYATQGNDRVWNAFTRVMDRANQAGVVVYSLDPRGLQTTMPTPEDDMTSGSGRTGSPQQVGAIHQTVTQALTSRAAFLRDTQEGLRYLAEQTGGFAFVDRNDLSGGVQRMLNDLQGYYLLGFEAPRSALRIWDTSRFTIRVKRPGLRVRARKGLFGPADPERPPEAAESDPLVAAALSPFGGGALDVRLTALFGHDAKAGSFVRALFFIDPAGVTFSENAGKHGAELTLLLLTVGDNGQAVSQLRRKLTLQLTGDELAQARTRGILYSARVPLKEHGAYQVRASVRDEPSGRVGSGSQFFEAPRVGVRRVALSGVVLQGTRLRAAVPDDSAAPPLSFEDTVFGEPSVRIFRPGSDAVYTCEIYDGVSEETEGLVTYATLVRDGRTVFESPPSPVSRKRDGSRLNVVPVAGRLTLSQATTPGPYTLRVTVAQKKGARVVREVSQWVDFEVR
jgi:VWFA-related protein